jgi:hypothetical protein
MVHIPSNGPGGQPPLGGIGAIETPSTDGSAAPDTTTALPPPGTTIAGGLAPTAPSDSAGDPTGAARVKALAANDQAAGAKVIDVLVKPSAQTSTSVSYKMPGRVLKPGESLYFAVPEALQGRPVNFMILGHRADPSADTDPTKGDKWDDTPALTSVQVHGKDFPEDKAWRYWKGSASGGKGSKFAEVSHSVELENLYEYAKYGTGAASDDSFSKQPVLPDAIRVVSTGEDPVTIHEVTLKITPPKPSQTLEAVFCEGTQIGDPETGAGRFYGGGQSHQGLFPGALELRGYGSGGAGAAKLPEGWKVVNGNLEIDLPAGKTITAVDVACGDSHPDKITNKDGGWGTKGWSKLSIGLKPAGGATQWFMNSENVPPEGVLSGSPLEAGYTTKAGDRIVIRASSDTTYVMAARIGLL